MQVLNRGGYANPDVLVVPRAAGPPVIVKDYGGRSRLVRRLLAPILVRHEQAMLERLAGLPGVPAPAGRVDSLALAMELIEGVPLRRRWHLGSLAPTFFDALEGILEGLAARRVAHLDLRSPTNVLSTPTDAPALVDLASAWVWPLPRTWARWIERRALAKLRARFEGERSGPPAESPRPEYRQLDLGAVRFRFFDRGCLADPVPAVFLHDVGLSATSFGAIMDRASDFSRRAIGVNLPGFAGSRGPGRSLDPRRLARHLERLLSALRVGRADLVGTGWGGVIARALAVRCPGRIRVLATLDSPLERLEGSFLRRWQEARRDPEVLRRRLERELPPGLSESLREELQEALRGTPAKLLSRAYAELPVRRLRGSEASGAADAPALALTGIGWPAQPWLAVETDVAPPGRHAGPGERGPSRSVRWAEPLGDAERLWSELESLARSTAPVGPGGPGA